MPTILTRLRISPHVLSVPPLQDGVAYPATLLIRALNGSRIDPLHARKMAARLQAATAGGSDRPALLRADDAVGHRAGKLASQQQAEFAAMWLFSGWALGADIYTKFG